MRLNVNPNRMQLLRLKKRLTIAKRGHKLLKDKQDQLMRDFLQLILKLKGARERLESEFIELSREFALRIAVLPAQESKGAFLCSSVKLSLRITSSRIMNIQVPHYEYMFDGDPISYSYYSIPPQVDSIIFRMTRLISKLVELAELEKHLYILATEIEKTRRRVNALEYILIPSIEETIKYIKSRLDEAERSNITRLMRVKEMLEVKREILERRSY